MVRICGAPSTRYFIFNHMRYLKHMRYESAATDRRTDMDMRGPRSARARASAGPLPQQRIQYTHRAPAATGTPR